MTTELLFTVTLDSLQKKSSEGWKKDSSNGTKGEKHYPPPPKKKNPFIFHTTVATTTTSEYKTKVPQIKYNKKKWQATVNLVFIVAVQEPFWKREIRIQIATNEILFTRHLSRMVN